MTDTPNLERIIAAREADVKAASKQPWTVLPTSEKDTAALKAGGSFTAFLFSADGDIADFDACDLAENIVNARLAALGPASVALARALAPFQDSAVTQGVGFLWRCPTCRQCSNTPGTIGHRDGCVARDALLAWAQAGGERGGRN